MVAWIRGNSAGKQHFGFSNYQSQAHGQMVKPLKKRNIQPSSSSVPCEQSKSIERFRVKGVSGQIVQPVENSSRSRVILASVRVVSIAQLAGNDLVAGENSHLSLPRLASSGK